MELSPQSLEKLQGELAQQVFGLARRLRFVVAPLPILVGGFVIVVDDTLWRRVLIGSLLLGLVITLALYQFGPHRFWRPTLRQTIIGVALLPHPIVLFATGGVYSPVVPVMLMVAFMASSMLESRTSRWLVGFQVSTIAMAALLEASQLVGSLIPPPFVAQEAPVVHSGWVFACAFVIVLFFGVTREMGRRLQNAFGTMLRSELAARDEALQLHREQLSELTALSAEIAHELKNPLASVKGLAALLSRRQTGADGEPLTVLRQEVDRMQGILEEFLNFSRPLLPLHLARIDLVELTREVCVLHAGIGATRAVEMNIEAQGPVEVVCDRRKVRQILVNLLQNALEVSPRDGRIGLVVEGCGAEVALRIADQGAGLDPRVAGRIFEAGVTTKEGGSGLGLNVARGLARQHGGEVTLCNAAGGGCVAVLSLPLTPPLGANRAPLPGNHP